MKVSETKETTIIRYQSASSGVKVTDRIVPRAAAVMVITAGCRLKWAASPSKAVITILVDAAASVSIWARVVIIADSRGLHRRRGWGRAGPRRILAFLGGV